MTPEKMIENKVINESSESEVGAKHNVRIDLITKRAIELAEFIMISDVDDSNSSSRRLLKQKKPRLKSK